jgi:hypothetical protein
LSPSLQIKSQREETDRLSLLLLLLHPNLFLLEEEDGILPPLPVSFVYLLPISIIFFFPSCIQRLQHLFAPGEGSPYLSVCLSVNKLATGSGNFLKFFMCYSWQQHLHIYCRTILG